MNRQFITLSSIEICRVKKRVSLIIMIVFYFIAGVNHFRNPAAYYRIIPDYLPYPYLINLLSGLAEIFLAILLIVPLTRKIAAYGIVVMLIVFIPAHIYMIQKGWCVDPEHCLPAWVAWIRLVPLQFLLMWWAWNNRK